MLQTYQSDVICCFLWDLEGTSYRRTNRTSWIHTTETSWWHTTDTSLGVSFRTCSRHRGGVLMRHRCCVLLRYHHEVSIRCQRDVSQRHLVHVPPRCRWVFHLRCTCDVAGTYRETSLRRCHDVATTSCFRVCSYWLKRSI